MDTIYYLWRFKMNETNTIPIKILKSNNKFIQNYKIITPLELNSLFFDTEICKNTFPRLASLYNLIPSWVVKTDLIRLLTIYFYGGIYSDADCFIKKPFTNVEKDCNVFLFTDCVLKSMNELGPRECKRPENLLRVANYFFACNVKEHPFFKDVINECISRLKHILLVEKKIFLNDKDILWTCGPDVITSVYHNKKKCYNDIYLFDNSYLNHKCFGSWRSAQVNFLKLKTLVF